MRAVVTNETPLPLKEVRQVVWWALDVIGINDQLVEVHIEHTSAWHHHGRFKLRSFSFMEQANRLIGARLLCHLPEHFNGREYDRKLRGGPPPIAVWSWQEALVCIVAHEGMHLTQWLVGPSSKSYTRNVRGKQQQVRGRMFSEVSAEWAEYHLLERYREEKS